tara:strand:- start:6785 stop:7885 length:1101 start_codon:yes stop_codon:yes gene_type:complete
MRYLIILFLFPITYYGQVAIGSATTVNSNVILDLTNGDNRGLLLNKTTNGPTAPVGNIYFDINYNMLSLVDTNGKVNFLSPWNYDATSPSKTYINGVNVGIGKSAPEVKLHVVSSGLFSQASILGGGGYFKLGNGNAQHLVFDNQNIFSKSDGSTLSNLYIQTQKLDVSGDINSSGKIKEGGYDLIPKRVIVMWSGVIADIPKGWALCNGNFYNPTNFSDVGSSATSTGDYTEKAPDLRERFIVGAGTANNATVDGSQYAPGVGTDAGRNSIAHAHDVNPDSFNTASTKGTHTHSGSTSASNTNMQACDCLGAYDAAKNSHSHTFSTAANQGAHVHAIDVPNTPSGAASNTENRPPYYALAFIMKL